MTSPRDRFRPALLGASVAAALLLALLAVGLAPDGGDAERLPVPPAAGAAERDAPGGAETLRPSPAARSRGDESAAGRAPRGAPTGETNAAPASSRANSPARASGDGPDARLVGTVADEDGRGVPGVHVRVLDAAGVALVAAGTDAGGAFELSLAAGALRRAVEVRVPRAPPGHVVARPSVALTAAHAAGEPVRFEARPWPPPVAGDVTGTLRARSGAWSDLEELLAGGVVLDLVSVAPPDAPLLPEDPLPRIGLQAELAAVPAVAPDAELRFRFADVPAGEYLLAVSSLRSARWSPATQRVVPPADGLVLVREEEPERELVFRVRDAATGAPVEGWTAWQIRQTVSAEDGVLMHAAPLPRGAARPPYAPLDWSLHAPGYAPAFGDGGAFRPEDGGRLVADVALAPGWGTRVLVLGRDPVMRPLAGAEVLLDGASAGRTGPRGYLVVRAAEAPQVVEVLWGARHLRRTDLPGPGSAAARGRGHVTPLVFPAADRGEDDPR